MFRLATVSVDPPLMIGSPVVAITTAVGLFGGTVATTDPICQLEAVFQSVVAAPVHVKVVPDMTFL
jgi:hypothetical protein